ncbi:hypothetical protein SERLA73DRAFT_149603 [Serpula lacrymans var. lacrymans S7.3]|uniref:Uncharacterized protein n=1 Tax=Serpula lacrymans var. lacrymans (strain S7.3) TaxID=936435 RepID=F8PJK5_SERL3|nr:hypothetical protein SERLA73DRAFT_149603 [Serpula lacrymans var. lacrymans S7.3]
MIADMHVNNSLADDLDHSARVQPPNSTSSNNNTHSHSHLVSIIIGGNSPLAHKHKFTEISAQELILPLPFSNFVTVHPPVNKDSAHAVEKREEKLEKLRARFTALNRLRNTSAPLYHTNTALLVSDRFGHGALDSTCISTSLPPTFLSSSMVGFPDSTASISHPHRETFIQDSGSDQSTRLPDLYCDNIPEGPAPIDVPAEPSTISKVLLFIRDRIRTSINKFGLGHQYASCPSYDPEDKISPQDLWQWMITGSHQKSEREVTQLVQDIILAPDFNIKDLHSFNARHANQVFDQSDSPSNDPFTYDGWKESEEKLSRQPPEPGCKLERVITALMFWSDSTSLASFGNAQAPIYMYLGNLSQYARGRLTSRACQRIAYIPTTTLKRLCSLQSKIWENAHVLAVWSSYLIVINQA